MLHIKSPANIKAYCTSFLNQQEYIHRFGYINKYNITKYSRHLSSPRAGVSVRPSVYLKLA